MCAAHVVAEHLLEHLFFRPFLRLPKLLHRRVKVGLYPRAQKRLDFIRFMARRELRIREFFTSTVRALSHSLLVHSRLFQKSWGGFA